MRKCPNCRRPAEWEANPWRPFCSERCQLIDFDRWTSEEYRVPGQFINPEVIEAPGKQGAGEEDDKKSG